MSFICSGMREIASTPKVGSRWLQVSCIGQMLCAVVADTREHAKRGAAAVRISYEDLPDPIFTIEVSEEETRSDRRILLPYLLMFILLLLQWRNWMVLIEKCNVVPSALK